MKLSGINGEHEGEFQSESSKLAVIALEKEIQAINDETNQVCIF